MKRSPLAVLFLVVFIDLVGFGIVLPLLPRYAKEYQAGGFAQGALLASFSAMQFLCSPFWGRLSDRIGRRPVLMIGLAGSIVSYSAFALSDSYGSLLASRIAAGFFGATIGTAFAYIADVTTPQTRGRGMALIGAAFGIGFTLGPAIGSLAGAGHTGLPGWIAAGLSAFAFVLAWFVLPEPERRAPAREGGIFGFAGIRHVVKTPTLPLIVLLQCGATLFFAVFESTLSRFTDIRFGMDIRSNGMLFAYVGLVLLCAQGGLVRRLMPRVGELRLCVAGAALMAAGNLLLALSGAVWLLYVALGVLVVGFAFVTPSLSSLLSRRSPSEMQGEVLGVNQSALSLARIAGPLAGNLLLDVGDGLPAILAAAGMGVCFVGACVLKSRPAPDSGTSPAV